MYTVYVLRDNKENLYKGMTSDMKRRMVEHRSGHTQTTAKMEDFEVVYKEEYDNFEDARNRELYFKFAAGRMFLGDKLPS